MGVESFNETLDISVSRPGTVDAIEMNWLHNPYGLCRWAEANYDYITRSTPPTKQTLRHVIEHWSFENSGNVDRPLFKKVVEAYGEVILKLECGYFWFDISSYIQLVEPHLQLFPRYEPSGNGSLRIKQSVIYDRQIGIPMEYFGDTCFGISDKYRPAARTLERYKEWYQQIINFAEMLQDPETVFYCSN